jgi:hypothetical protein
MLTFLSVILPPPFRVVTILMLRVPTPITASWINFTAFHWYSSNYNGGSPLARKILTYWSGIPT